MTLEAGDEPLAQALCKNILNGERIESARRLALYTKAVIEILAGQDEQALLAVSWKFPSPMGLSAQP
jgi:cytochrome b pre-mRNA-processing protein 3